MKKILVTLLIILTIILMYTIIFPKKSYVETLLEKELAPEIEETFNKNVNTLKIASNEYFKENPFTLYYEYTNPINIKLNKKEILINSYLT